MLGIKNRPPDARVLGKFPAYAAMIERLILDEHNHQGFYLVIDNSTHRSVWYAVLNHYRIQYKKHTLNEDYVNGYEMDRLGNKYPLPVCDYKSEGVYHWKDFCCSTCENVPERVIDVSTKRIDVGSYNFRRGKYHRLFCTSEEQEDRLGEYPNDHPEITDATVIVKASNGLHPPTIYR